MPDSAPDKGMTLSIYCSELYVDDEPPKEHIDANGYVFVNGMKAINSNGDELFNVSGSDEYGATIHNVQSYTISTGTYTAGYVTATIEEDYDKRNKEIS
jgi:hypothetical protein|tara:strand:+ start:513 stop:809 length:297 start_codon:yes stop_codon:yes gene_type:complete